MLTDPSGSSAVIDAVQWVRDVLLGTVATSVAVLAIASAGLLMLSGRLEVRRGITVILGCFIVFGAPSIARGLMFGGNERHEPFVGSPSPMLPTAFPSSVAMPAREGPVQRDPYAGASVPVD